MRILLVLLFACGRGPVVACPKAINSGEGKGDRTCEVKK